MRDCALRLGAKGRARHRRVRHWRVRHRGSEEGAVRESVCMGIKGRVRHRGSRPSPSEADEAPSWAPSVSAEASVQLLAPLGRAREASSAASAAAAARMSSASSVPAGNQ